jgi:hypothetical protein
MPPNAVTLRDADRHINLTQVFRLAGFTNYNITTFVSKHGIDFKSVPGGHNIDKGRWADLSACLKVCDILLVNLELNSPDEPQARALKRLRALVGSLIHEDHDPGT